MIALSHAAAQFKLRAPAGIVAESKEAECRAIAEAAVKEYCALPATKSFELYIIQAIAVPVGGKSDSANVIYPPEFLFLLDVGFESLVGVSIFWTAKGLGDPMFPDFSKSALRSITSRDINALIF